MLTLALRAEQSVSQHRRPRGVLLPSRVLGLSAILQTRVRGELRVSTDSCLREQEVHGSLLGLLRLER